MALYGTGYRLGTAMAGLTGGVERGLENRAAAEERDRARADIVDYRNRSLGMQERQMEAQERTARMRQIADGMRMALEASEKTGDPEAFGKIFKIFNPDMEPPQVKLNGPDIVIDTPEYTLIGPRETYMKMLEIGVMNPEKTDELHQNWIKYGGGRAIKKERKPSTTTVSPGQRIVDPTTGKVIYAAPETTQQDKPMALAPGQTYYDPRTGKSFSAPGQTGGSAAKVSDYSTFISNTMAKYKIPRSVNLEGLASNDPVARAAALNDFLSGEQGAYSVIQQKAAQGDREAIQDLADLRAAYGAMKQILGIGQAPAAPAGTMGRTMQEQPGSAEPEGIVRMPMPANPGTIGQTMAPPLPPDMQAELDAVKPPAGAKNKAVYDPKTGRFVYR